MSSGLDPSFNGTALSTYGFVSDRIEFQWAYPDRPRKSALADGGVAQEISMNGRIVRISGVIKGEGATENTDSRDKLSNLLLQLRGTDREKKGRLDIYGDGHLYCQLIGSIPSQTLRGEGIQRITLEFFADDPFRRGNTMKSVNEVVSASDTIATLTYATDFDGDAPRMPLIINLGGGWTQGDLVRIQNTVTSTFFEYVVSQTLAASQDLVIDGETHEVLENNEVKMEGICGLFPYIRGGVTNTFDFDGTEASMLGTFNFSFWDRYMA